MELIRIEFSTIRLFWKKKRRIFLRRAIKRKCQNSKKRHSGNTLYIVYQDNLGIRFGVAVRPRHAWQGVLSRPRGKCHFSSIPPFSNYLHDKTARRENTDLIISGLNSVISGNETTLIRIKDKKGKNFLYFIFLMLYGFIFLLSFGVVILILNRLNFNIMSIALLLFS